ncbi:MAG: type II CRISPR-associated endonuclease Cas1 [Bacteroidota bacterium]
MLKRTLFISNPCYVSTKMEQLVLKNKKNEEEKTVPIEDIGFVVFENGECTFSLQALSKLNENNVAAIFCNDKHLPASMLLTLDANDVQSQMFAHQLRASEPLKKQLWQQTIKAKISNQALLLKSFGIPHETLKRCTANVKSGDTTNEEAKASRYYWSNFFTDASTRPKKQDLLSMTIPVTLSERSESKSGHTSTRPDKEHRDSLSMTKKFVRDRFGDPPNNLFNYGYAILRAAVARALAGSGLLPTIGIHHHNKYNAFCLADDIMEPYRPFVDRIVHSIVQEGKDFSVLTTELKARLLTVLTDDIGINGTASPLMVGLSQTTASLAECFAGERKTIKYPELI